MVFHLAAYKHIGMMEEHPDQAFETNVLGTLNVFEAAQAVQAEEVVFLSSHTAVNPASVYGATKRVGELLVTLDARGPHAVLRRAPDQRDRYARHGAGRCSRARSRAAGRSRSPTRRWRATS